MQKTSLLLALTAAALASCGGGGSQPRYRLAFSASPSLATSGRSLGTVRVNVLGSNGAVDTTATPVVTLALSGSGATLGGTVATTAVAGVATFTAATATGTASAVQLRATAPDASAATSSAFAVVSDATQLVITSAVPSSIAPLTGFDVTVELRTATGGVATQLTDAVTLGASALPDLLWHASGNGTRVTELVEVTSAPNVIATLPNSISGEIYGATWSESAGSLVVTDINKRVGLANPTTGDEARYAAAMSQNLRAIVFDGSGTAHGANPFANEHYTFDPVSGVETLVGPWAFAPVGLTTNGSTSLATDPVTNTVYGIIKDAAASTNRRLVTIDLATSTLTDLGATGDRFASISFNPSGVLYAVTGNGATVSETLFTLDKATGAATQVGALGNGADGEVIARLPRGLRGTTTVNAVAGVATFSNVWFEQIGTDGSLRATTTALTSAVSSNIQITGLPTAGTSVQFDAASSTVAENVTGGTTAITLSLGNAVDYALPVMVRVDSSTATNGGATPDVRVLGLQQVVFAPGETSKTITIEIVDDATVEGSETLSLTIVSAVLATSIGPNGTHTVTITDND